MDYMAPKMDNFVQKLEQYAGTKLPITKVRTRKSLPAIFQSVCDTIKICSMMQDKYPYILAAATALELTGSLFFIFDSAMGAKTLLLFLVPVSFIMHNFWDVPAKNSELRMQETIHFSKNLALCGALLFYLGMKRR